MNTAPRTAAQTNPARWPRMATTTSHIEPSTRNSPSPAWKARIRGARAEVSAQTTLWYEPAKKSLAPCPGWLSGIWENRFTYMPRPNWTRRATSSPKAQPRALRFLRPRVVRTAAGAGAVSPLVAAGCLLLPWAMAHLRPIALLGSVMAVPGLVDGEVMRESLHCRRDHGHGRRRGSVNAEPPVGAWNATCACAAPASCSGRSATMTIRL